MAENEYIITVEMLKDFDEMYEATEDISPTMKRHLYWGSLVEALRDIRRRIQAGVTVKVEGTDTVFTEWWDFYEWCHGRYHVLEDGFDKWIGDDR